MNPVKSVYCRTYQGAFKLMLPILPYSKPEILKSTKKVPDVLSKEGKSHPLLVTDPFLYNSKVTSSLEEALKKAGLKLSVFDGVCANPTTENILRAYDIYKEQGCDCIIGFGGGSSIDCAKAVGAKAACPKKTFKDMSGVLGVLHRTPLMIAIPTTAGTGSETTLAAVVTDEKTRDKYALMDFALIPEYAVLDPNLTVTLPSSMTSTTGMDALTHAVEAYIGRSTTKETRREARKAVQLIFDNIEEAYNNGKNLKARENMLLAAFLAGDAFSKSYVGYVHAIAHSLGGKYNTAHGLANAVLLPVVLEGYGSIIDKKLHELAVCAGISRPEDDIHESAKKFIEAIKNLNKAMNIPTTIKGIKREDIDELAAHAEKEANPLYPVPVLWTKADLVPFYYAVMEN